MRKFISLFALFVAAFFTGVIYQNCSNDSTPASLKEKPEKDEPVEDKSGNFVVDLSNGGHILYKIAVSDLNTHPSMEGEDIVSSNLISLKFNHHFLESSLYKDSDVTNASCLESAFPHCLYIREREEHQNPGYRFVHSPLECHWQHRLSEEERTGLFTHIQSIKYATITEAGTNRPDDNKCILSTLSFTIGNENLSVILDHNLYEDSVCLPSGTKYGNAGNIDELKSFFATEVSELTTKKNDEEGFCNSYSAYSRETTSWSYHASGGTYPGSVFSDAEYNGGGSTVKLRWRETAGGEEKCAESVPVSTEQLNVFFPEEGLKYKFYYSDGSSPILGGGSWSISYKDPFDNDNKWTFGGSNVRSSGGAVLEDSKIEAVKNIINALKSMAGEQDLLTDCPD